MKKYFSGLLILILLVLFTTTYLCSSKTEEVFKGQIAQLNQTYPNLLKVELLDYQRGLLISRVRTKLSLRQDAVELNHRIRHFPWKVRMLTSFTGAAANAGLEPLQLESDIQLDGSSQSRLSLTSMTVRESRTQLQLQGVQFSCELDRQLSAGRFTLALDELKLVDPQAAEMLLTGLQLSSKFADLQGLPVGDSQLQLEKLLFQPTGKPGFVLDGLSYQTETQLADDQLTSTLDLRLDDLQLAGERFSAGQLRLRLGGITAAAVRELQTNARQLQTDLQVQQPDPVVVQFRLLSLYAQLLQEGLTIDLETLALQADGGSLSGQGMLTLQEPNFSGGSLLGLGGLIGQFRLDVDQVLFKAGFRALEKLQWQTLVVNSALQNEHAEQLAGGLVQKGILLRREDGYRLELSLDRGEGVLNGVPFRL